MQKANLFDATQMRDKDGEEQHRGKEEGKGEDTDKRVGKYIITLSTIDMGFTSPCDSCPRDGSRFDLASLETNFDESTKANNHIHTTQRKQSHYGCICKHRDGAVWVRLALCAAKPEVNAKRANESKRNSFSLS